MNIGDLFFALRADGKGLEADITRQATNAANKAGPQVNRSLGRSISSSLGRGVGTLLGAGGGALFAGAIEGAVQLEDQLRTIQTVVPDLDLSKAEDDIQALSRETGKTTDDLTAGFYDLVSAGVPAEQAISVLRDSAKFATGALGTTAESVDLVTSALNAYGLGAESSSRITDIFAKAVADGKVTASELGASIANIAPIAASAGVSLEEVSAGYALLTAKGVPAAQAATQMRAAISALLTPNAQLNKLQEETGINFAELAKEKGLAVALEAVRKATNGNNDAFAKSLGSIEAYQFALATTGENAEAMAAQIIETSNATGLAQEQYEIKSQSAAEQGKRFAAQVQTLLQDLGGLASGLGPVLFGLNQLGPALGGLVSPARLLGGALGGLAGHLASGFRGLVARILPSAALAGTTTGAAMGTAAAASEVATQATGVTAGQATVAARASPAARLAGGLIGRAMGLAASAAVLAIPITIAVTAAIIGDHVLDGIKNEIEQKTIDAIADGSVEGLKARRAELTDRLRIARAAHLSGPMLDSLVKQLDDVERAISERTSTPDMSPEARQSRTDLHDLAQAALADQRRGERSDGRLASIESTLTATQKQTHDDLMKAIDTIESSSDPTAVSAAIASAVAAVLKGSGSAETTRGLIADLKEQLRAAEAANNAPLAAQIKAAIAQLEPFAKGRQWQREQLDKAQKVVDSNKSTADKVTELRGIQRDLLDHNRKMAADLVAKQIDTIQAIDRLPQKLRNALGGILFSGRAPGKEEDDRNAGLPPRRTARQESPNPDRRANAAGLVGLTRGTTDIGIAGEAGTEAIAILRNPKRIANAVVRVFVTNWPNDRANGMPAAEPVDKRSQALAAIRRRAIAAGHTGASGLVGDTLRDDLEKGYTLDEIIAGRRLPAPPQLFVPSSASQTVPVESVGAGGEAGATFAPTINVEGLIKARDPFEIASQLRRVRDFVVVTPRRQPA